VLSKRERDPKAIFNFFASELPVPGGFDARLLYEKTRMTSEKASTSRSSNQPDLFQATDEEPFALQDYWIGRYQVWWMDDFEKCKGEQ
jgi:hypothetical protein